MRLVPSMRHPRNSKPEELLRACAACVAGAFGAFGQRKALEVVGVTKQESFVWVIEAKQ